MEKQKEYNVIDMVKVEVLEITKRNFTLMFCLKIKQVSFQKIGKTFTI